MWFANKTPDISSSQKPALVLNALTDELSPFPARIDSTATQPSINLQPGDDPTPPNGVSQNNLNGITVVVAASAGFSTAPPMENFHPSNIHYDVDVSLSSFTMSTVFEFENPYYATHVDGKTESMVVKAKVAKFIAVPDSNKELQLISTKFQDWDEFKHQWVDITTSIAYAAQAKAVVDAVIQTQSDQTAGMATVQDESFDVTLGPVGMKGRILSTFSCGVPFVYDAMGLAVDGSDIGKGRLIPVSLFLPWASLTDQKGGCGVSFDLKAPASSITLSPSDCGDAYRHLHGQKLLQDSTMIAVASLKQEPTHATARHAWSCLPISPTFVLIWLLVPNDNDFGFELLSIEEPVPKETELKVTVLQPSTKDNELLMQSLPGAGYNPAQLTRIIIDAPRKAFPRIKPQLVLNIGLSDASGSTGCSSGSTTVRAQFNEMTKRRFLKRIFSIPVLLEAGILQPHDVWTDVAIVFDGSARDKRVISFRVSDFKPSNLIQDATTGNVKVAPSAMFSNDKVAKEIVEFVTWSGNVQPGGWTDFVKPAEAATSMIHELVSAARQLTPNLETSSVKSFIDFDTDGGHNGTSGDVTTAIKSLVETAAVRNGIVTGFGAWVNQDIASKVAALLGPNPALLGLHVPKFGQEGMDRIFATGFTAWVDALRFESFDLSVTAGAFSKNTDAIQVLFAKRDEKSRIEFGAVDVSNVEYTGSVINGVSSGDSLILYATSRLDVKTLAERIEVKINGVKQNSSSQVMKPEVLEGPSLAFEWLAVTGGKDSAVVSNSSVAVPNLITRIEDNISFAYNIPTLTGSTAYLGRATNAGNRAPVDKAHQPPDATLTHNLRPVAAVNDSTELFSFGGARSREPLKKTKGFGGMASAQTLTAGRGGRGGMAGGKMAAKSFRAASYRSRAPPAPPVAAVVAPPVVSFGALPAFSFSSQQQMQAQPQQPHRAQQQVHSQSKMIRPPEYQEVDSNTVSNSCWSSILNRSSNLKATVPGTNQEELPAEVLANLQYTIQKLLGTVTIKYVCDTCNREIDDGQARFHCLDCFDFDECQRCNGGHVSKMAFHRVVSMNGASTSFTIQKDPLLEKLLGINNAEKPATLAPFSTLDVTAWSHTRMIKRLLVAMLEWWIEIKVWLHHASTLPDVLDNAFLAEVRSAFRSPDEKQIFGVGMKIVDTLIRSTSK
ncbi:hypothetical protein HDU79_002533 [Rhizoclosmatium sp. JEL0117]|nr:hypothetical protein HDU79_002533 [Rhizoclosmatium sp. JEL0117]